jgi:hypothetical protein
MSLKISEIFSSMFNAAKDSFGDDWPKAKDHARPKVKKLAQSLVDITKLVATDKVNTQQATALLQIHKNTTQMVMLTIEGLGIIIAVENAINAALNAAADVVNTAAGIKLL